MVFINQSNQLNHFQVVSYLMGKKNIVLQIILYVVNGNLFATQRIPFLFHHPLEIKMMPIAETNKNNGS